MPPDLMVTGRCLQEDLGLRADQVERSIAELADRHPVLDHFLKVRTTSPTGQEVLTGLAAKIVAYTLHSGRFRGLTWYDERFNVVWLLAAHMHRSGDADDAYPYFRELDSKRQLLPIPSDYLALSNTRRYAFAKALRGDVDAALVRARGRPDIITEAVIGGRVRVRLLIATESPDVPMLHLAMSMRLLPEDIDMPEQWFPVVLAAFFRKNAEDIMTRCSETTLAGHALRGDEVAFCDFDWREPQPDDC